MVGASRGLIGGELGSLGSMSPQKVTRRSLAYLWTFIELHRSQKLDARMRIGITIDLMQYLIEHHAPPDTIVVSRETYDVLSEFEAPLPSQLCGVPVTVVDMPDGIYVLAKKGES